MVARTCGRVRMGRASSVGGNVVLAARVRLTALVLALSFTAVPPACGVEEIRLAPPALDGWRLLTFPKVQRPTHYTPIDVDGVPAVRAESACAAAALVLTLADIDLTRTPRLRWRWKVERGLTIDNERSKAGDDFAARVYVMFRFDAEHATLAERLRHRLGTALYGDEVPGNAIDYVWTSHEPAGARWDNPFAATAKMVSRGPAPPGAWKTEEVDVAADYVAFFGTRPPPLAGLALMTDSDNSCTTASALFADFRLLGR